ncbi:MAG: ABC transporter permease [Actinobacteria bacterium]|nr:MAG: ABC transporter permease [Actinomycetota bacterium]
MSRTAAIPFTIPDERHGLGRIGGAISDAIALWQRNLIGLRRTPQTIVFSTLQPVIFVLLFRYVFGGAVSQTLTVPYVDYLMPGIFCQMVVFGAMLTAVGLAADLKSGMLERFHSLPMSRSAVLAGRTTADLTRNFFVVILVSIAGFIVGFRIHTNVFGFLAGMGLVLLFGYALSWVFATVGLAVGDPETAQAASFPVMAPLVFASSAFVSVATMPGWLRPFAEHQPVSVTASAVRALMIGNTTPGTSTATYVWQALAWLIGLIVVFAPIAVRQYRKAV